MERKPLSPLERTGLPQIAQGLRLTWRHMFEKPVTLEYPEQKPALPTGYRGAPTLVKDPDGREKCVSCQLCEFVCPPKAIRIVPGAIASDAPYADVEKAPESFEIDFLRCIYCGLCQEVCPEEAIFLKQVYSLNGLSRAALVLDKNALYKLGGAQTDEHFKWKRSFTSPTQPASEAH
mgnify:CR=1 FL=1